HASIWPQLAIHLLATGPRGFTRRAFASRLPSILLEFVGTVEVRNVSRGVQTCANGKIIDRSTRLHQSSHRLLIEVAAGQYAHLPEPSRIENAPDFARKVR